MSKLKRQGLELGEKNPWILHRSELPDFGQKNRAQAGNPSKEHSLERGLAPEVHVALTGFTFYAGQQANR